MMKNSRLFRRQFRYLFCGALLTAVAGCVGVVGGYDGPDYYAPGYFTGYGPDVTIFGGYHSDHHWDHDYEHRGAVSRGFVGHAGGGHPGGGHVGGSPGGGGHGGGGHH
jgi:hypothetical protein